MKKGRIFIAWGANILPSETSLKNYGLEILDTLKQITLNASPIYKSESFPKNSGPDFVNGVIEARWAQDANALLAYLHDIENSFDRVRSFRWAPRSCDLDILEFNNEICPDLTTYEKWRNLSLEEACQQTPQELILPHPRLHERSFVLKPWSDIAPDFIPAGFGQSVSELLNTLPLSATEGLVRL